MADEFNTDSMLSVFLYESSQLLEKLEGIILDKQDADSFDDSDINEIFRIMHTIKGSSGVLMYENITKASHKLEDVFYYLRESHPEDVPHLELVEKVLAVSDFITGELDKIKDGNDPDGDEKALVEDLDDFLSRIKGEIKKQGIRLPKANKSEEPTQFYVTPVAGEDSHFYRIVIHYRNDTQMSNIRAYSATYALKEIAEDLLYTPEDILSNEASADTILAEGFYMLLQTKSSKDEVLGLVDSSEAEHIDIEELSADEYGRGLVELGREEPLVAINLDDGKPGPKEEGKAPAPGDYVVKSKEVGKGKTIAKNQPKQQSIVSVNVEKMDALMDLIGELVISEATVLQNPDLKVPGLDLSNFQKAAAQLSKNTTELQDIIMSMRMMPLTNTFQKMRRIVFDVSRKLGKDIEFEVIGETTEVDKNIIEHISDPLMHLVRNSVDHGIEENPEDRTAYGKPAKGKITLEAKNEGGKVYISVKDDGKGLNKEKLYNKAFENGLIDKPMSEFTEKEIFRFITLPGFSTKEEVTEYSGRGVGMDVVVKNIQSIGGRLDIESVENHGSQMTLVIPLTLAIINGIVVQVGGSTFVIETASIKQFVRVGKDAIVQEPSGEEYMVLRGEYYSFIRLNEKYDLQDSNSDVEKGIVVVLEHEGKQVCILIDTLLQEQEIVVKPIPSYIKKVKGLSGCTQLGDGSIAMILDIAGLIQDEERR